MARKPGYFNDRNYYSFYAEDDGSVSIDSECCGDTLDMEAAIELRGLLDNYIGWTDGR